MSSIYHGLRTHRAPAPPVTGPARQRAAEQAGEASFDPGAHTVSEVLAYIAAHPDEAPRIRSVEQNGRNRKTIVEG